ncbi:hypothetical protein [Neobacillus vireti]|uniref:hypothetical protein n=1 Tax=Neobacillus vireti TaxID=220686 RepID=UPI002FFFE4CC
MKVKALVSFAGVVTMALNEVKEIEDKVICDDLLRAGFVEEVKSARKKSVNTDEN